MFASRAPFILDVAYLVTLAAPAVALQGVRLARRRKFTRHRQLHQWLLAIAVLAVLAIEGQIRLAGGTSALLKGSPFAHSRLFNIVALVHIGVAVLTYLL